jgi:hypothetical protein
MNIIQNINEIIINKDKLVSKINDTIKMESDSNLMIILQNHQNYLGIIDDYMKELVNTKNQLNICVNLLESKLNDKNIILEIKIASEKIGKINDFEYIDTYYELGKYHIIHIDLKKFNGNINIINNNIRILKFKMIYENNIILTYIVNFNLLNEIDGIIKCTFSTIR